MTKSQITNMINTVAPGKTISFGDHNVTMGHNKGYIIFTTEKSLVIGVQYFDCKKDVVNEIKVLHG